MTHPQVEPNMAGLSRFLDRRDPPDDVLDAERELETVSRRIADELAALAGELATWETSPVDHAGLWRIAYGVDVQLARLRALVQEAKAI